MILNASDYIKSANVIIHTVLERYCNSSMNTQIPVQYVTRSAKGLL